MKIFTFLIAFIFINFSPIVEKKITKTGKIIFEASVPTFEEVKATNESVSCILNIENGEIAALALMKGFRFKVALMEEHFNENYMESNKYPKATFKGKIEKFDFSKLTSVDQKFTIKGTLSLHGISKDINILGKINKKGEDLNLMSNFTVNVDDFNIEIPSLVSNKVSKQVNIKLDFHLQ